MAEKVYNRLEIRLAEKKDIKRIGELLEQVNRIHHDIRPDLFRLGRKYSEKELENIIGDKSTPVFVVTDREDGMLIGYCMTRLLEIKDDQIRTDLRTIYIDDLCVDTAFRGRHAGLALYEAVKDFARRNGCQDVTLHVWEGNDGARAFYETMGMKPMYTCMEEKL